MNRLLWLPAIFIATCFAAPASSTQASRNVVLVADARSDIRPLTASEIRRLFLGVPVYQQGRRIIPVINDEDRLLYEIFLQKAIFLSAGNYEKQLVRRVFQHGGSRPLNPDDVDIREVLRSDTQYVTFMWEREIARDPELRIVQQLWHGTVE